MNDKSIKVSVSIPSDVLEPAKRHARAAGVSFSGLVTDAVRNRLESLGLLADNPTEQLHRQLDELIALYGPAEAANRLKREREAQAV